MAFTWLYVFTRKYLFNDFYTTVSGWMLKYFYNFITGQFNGLSTADVQNVFSQVLASPSTNVFG